MNYLKSFIIGSSFPATFFLFQAVKNIPDSIKNYSFQDYTVIAPIYLGLANLLSLCLSKIFNLSLQTRFLLIGILSPLFVISIVRSNNSYNFTEEEWRQYYFRLITKHFMIFNLIIYNLEYYLN